MQPGYMPPLGASPYTWPNIFKNMKRMDYCVDKFDFLGNREVSKPLNHDLFNFASFVVQGERCYCYYYYYYALHNCFAFQQDVWLQGFLSCLWICPAL